MCYQTSRKWRCTAYRSSLPAAVFLLLFVAMMDCLIVPVICSKSGDIPHFSYEKTKNL